MSIQGSPNKPLERKLNIVAIVISVIVLFLVGLMRRVKLDLGMDFSFLPAIHAGINVLTAIALVIAYRYIRRGEVEKHRNTIYVAIGLSVLFLVSYVLYHFTTPETSFCKEGIIRYIYFFILITHIVLAAVIFPFILFTFIRAYTNQFDRHKRMARWVFPVWLYVAVTGPIVYVMLLPCY